MQNNPYNLKQVDEIPAGYLDADEFVNFLNKNKIIIKRKDNLPRLAYNNSISMLLVTRIGRAGSAFQQFIKFQHPLKLRPC